MNQTPPARIVLKISGEFLALADPATPQKVAALAADIMALAPQYQFALVIGGGNIFRGSQQGKKLGLSTAAAHYAGMVATMINGIILKDLFEQSGCQTSLISGLTCPSLAETGGYRALTTLKEESGTKTPIFVCGIGSPYFTTDTAAVVQALQLGAEAVWKLTNVDGIYSADPRVHPSAQKISHISHSDYLAQRLGIIDEAAVALAREQKLPILVTQHEADRPLRKIVEKKQSVSLISTHNGQ